ncbi:MAG: 4a-hydroxytetrahydrobiopterin dehydratase [Coxiella sp. (in: Bacteria)]|nr:MAG: 4a-hydroxytetrahydrobiopterin dehydratase [Coxiella sp. (in: g-proteobacteria)]
MNDLTEKKCTSCEIGTKPLSKEDIAKLMKLVPEWSLNQDQTRITRIVDFKGYYKTMAFVNAVAWIANAEGHHPDLEVSYNKCIVHFTTHAADGLTNNDYICAAKVDRLLT